VIRTPDRELEVLVELVSERLRREPESSRIRRPLVRIALRLHAVAERRELSRLVFELESAIRGDDGTGREAANAAAEWDGEP
jgi:hypothetical protein